MTLPRLVVCGLLILILSATYSALAAGNAVSSSSLGTATRSIGPNDLKPAACAHITIQVILTGNGNLSGGNQNTLVIGGPGNQTLSGGPGQDCIVAGGGTNSLSGGPGADVLIGGPGTNAFNGGPGTDICYSRSSTDTFTSCETIVRN
jgi:Ca2+-binding RTX toxin-like protein